MGYLYDRIGYQTLVSSPTSKPCNIIYRNALIKFQIVVLNHEQYVFNSKITYAFFMRVFLYWVLCVIRLFGGTCTVSMIDITPEKIRSHYDGWAVVMHTYDMMLNNNYYVDSCRFVIIISLSIKRKINT